MQCMLVWMSLGSTLTTLGNRHLKKENSGRGGPSESEIAGALCEIGWDLVCSKLTSLKKNQPQQDVAYCNQQVSAEDVSVIGRAISVGSGASPRLVARQLRLRVFDGDAHRILHQLLARD